MRLATGLAEDNSLEKPLAFSHVFDLRAFAPLYVNHKQKTHRINYLMRTLLQIVVEKWTSREATDVHFNAFVNFQDQYHYRLFM